LLQIGDDDNDIVGKALTEEEEPEWAHETVSGSYGTSV
jgi:hypothetical protein